MKSVGPVSLLTAAVLMTACEQEAKEKPTPPPPLVTAAKPIFGEYRDFDEYIGRIDAANVVELRARVGGYLEKIHFSAGDFVETGALLYTIDQSTYKATLRGAEANLASAKAAEALALATLERNRPLITQGVISQQEFDVFSAQYVATQAATLAAQAALDSAQLDLNFTEIKAPVAGRISNSPIDPGNLVLANNTVLATIVSQEPMYAYFDIDENALLRYRNQRPAGVSGDDQTLKALGIPVTLALGDEQNFSIEGLLDYGDPKVNESTGTIRVRAVFGNKDRKLVSGLFARVRVSAQKSREVVQLPLRAIGTDQNRKFVYVIDEKGAAQYREVLIGPQSSSLAVIEKGLDPKDTVVIDGILRLRPGVAPEVKEADLSPFMQEAQPAEVAPPAPPSPAPEAAAPENATP